MAGTALLLRAEAFAILFVVGAYVGLVDGDVLLGSLEVQHEVFDTRLLRHLELSDMLFVIGLQVRIADSDLGRELTGSEARHLDLAPVIEGVEHDGGLRRCREGRIGNAFSTCWRTICAASAA